MEITTQTLPNGGKEINLDLGNQFLSLNLVFPNGIKVNIAHRDGGDLNITPITGNLNGIRFGSSTFGMYLNIGQNRLELNGNVYINGVQQ